MGLPRRPRLARGSDSGVPLQLVGVGQALSAGDGGKSSGVGGDRAGAELPAGQGLRLSQVFQEGRSPRGGARNPRGRCVYTDPELTSGLVSTLRTRPGWGLNSLGREARGSPPKYCLFFVCFCFTKTELTINVLLMFSSAGSQHYFQIHNS